MIQLYCYVFSEPATYRYLSKLLALSLVLSIAVPVVQHACAMGQVHETIEAVGGDGTMDEDCHDHESEAAELPCALDDGCDEGEPVLRDLCCELTTVEAIKGKAYLNDRSISVVNTLTAPLVVSSLLIRDDRQEHAYGLVYQVIPDKPSASLYILHESFLI